MKKKLRKLISKSRRSFWKRQPRFQPGAFVSHRAEWIAKSAVLIFCGITLRAITIHLFPSSSDALQNIAERQYQRHLELAPYRGTIFDRRGEPLAISMRTPSLFVNPRVFSVNAKEAIQLGSILQMPPDKVVQIANKKNYFAWLKRRLPKDAAQKAMDLKIKGLYQVMEPARYYPAGFSASHLLGYVGSENRGLMGIEQAYEKTLRGNTVAINESRDARGKTIFLQSAHAAPEKSGQSIYLTIDRAIQEISEKALDHGIKAARAKDGFAIVADPHTGRILAMANSPGFDPNSQKKIDPETTRNHAVGDLFEPGSVVKPFVVAHAIAQKKVKITDSFFCENGVLREQTFRIRDSHAAKTLTLPEVLIHSSNICTYKIAKTLGPEKLAETFADFGFGMPTNLLEFPGKSVGRLSDWREWRPVRFANVAFGQGFVTSGLEIVRAYSALANGGTLLEPYIVDKIESSEGETTFVNSTKVIKRVLDPQLAREMRGILQRVVEEGSGKKAHMAEFTAGGKTGTTEKVDPKLKAYSADLRIASFAGFAPVADPHLVIYVVIDEPHIKPYFGGTWAAPVFKEIAEESLKYLNVAPDQVPSTNTTPESKFAQE